MENLHSFMKIIDRIELFIKPIIFTKSEWQVMVKECFASNLIFFSFLVFFLILFYF